MGPFGAESGGYFIADLLLPQQGRIEQGEGAGFNRSSQVCFFAGGKFWFEGSKIDSACGAKVFRRLEDVAFLPVVQRNFLHVVQ